MAIATVLAIKTDIHGYRDRTSLETNIAIVTALVIKTDMAIITALVIETDIHGYHNRTDLETNIQMQRTRSKIASGVPSMLESSTRRLPRLSLVFCVAVFPWLGTLCRVVTFLVTVETSDMTQIFASRAGNVAWGYRHRRLG